MMASEALQSLSLKVMVEKEKNQVVFAESNSDFVDVLFSFMTMTTGNIIRLAREHSLEVNFGCLNNLYQSVENLDEKHLRSVKCKDLLLRPRSAAEIYCRNLKLNLFNCDTNVYYYCCKDHHYGPYYYAPCNCGGMNGYIWNTCNLNNRVPVHQDEGVFVKPTTRFIITDDFHVKPVSTMTGLTLLSEFGATCRTIREERTISIGRDKVMKLIMCSLTSRAPFSETILESDIDKNSSDICHKNYGSRSTVPCQRAMKADTKISLKLIINKSNNRVLYVEAKEDFVDLIASFLTFPLGFVFEKFTSLSLRGCLGNLYKSIQDFDAELFFKSEEVKSILVNPKLTPGLALDKQLIPIEAASYPSYSTVSSLFNVYKRGGIGGEKIIEKGFIRGSSMFMVTDDFTITPLSSFSGISFIDRLNIPLSDILEQEVIMGEEEALRLLEAAFMSKTVLTDVFVPKELKRKLKEDSDN